MSFQFNFFKSATSTEAEASDIILPEHVDADMVVTPCTEWIPAYTDKEQAFSCEAVEGNSGLVKRSFSEIQALQTDLSKISEQSDLVPKKYEGGLKTWECSIDLLNFLYESESSSDFLKTIKNGHVLEVGCGSALPGIFCLSRGSAERVVFQDYNRSVLETVTLPNILLNQNQKDALSRCSFFYGDWNKLPDNLVPHSFDLILTSETIYRAESYPALLNIFSKALRMSCESSVILAAKDYYFGLGGSVKQFSIFAQDNGWSVQTLRHFVEGVPRSIIKLTRQNIDV